MRISIDNRVTFKKTQPIGCDLRGFKKYPSTNMTYKIPPFTNDNGKNRLTKDLAYLTLKYKG